MNSKLKRMVRSADQGDLYVAFSETLRRDDRFASNGAGVATAVTSASSGEGKTYVAMNLAIQAAAANRGRTLLVDAAPSSRRSATRLLLGRRAAAELEAATEARCVETEFSGVDVLSWGPRLDGVTSGQEASLTERLEQARSDYSLIVIDTMSMRDGPRTLGLLRCADQVTFVVEYRRRSVGQIRSYLDQIEEPSVLGVVLNKRRYPIPQVIYDRL